MDKQPEAVQRKVLGNAGYEAYKAGAVTLQDFVGQKHSHAWGSTRYAKSLKEILGPEEAKKWAGIEKKQPPGLSPHPVDQLIRDLIRSGQPASTAEVTQITTRVAQADFPTITRHVNKRVGEKQWADGITEKEYLADIRRAVLDKESRLVIYERHGGNIAGILAETAKIVPESRRGRDFLPLLFVAYSADRGIILSGYQASVLEKISIPENARWLK